MKGKMGQWVIAICLLVMAFGFLGIQAQDYVAEENRKADLARSLGEIGAIAAPLKQLFEREGPAWERFKAGTLRDQWGNKYLVNDREARSPGPDHVPYTEDDKYWANPLLPPRPPVVSQKPAVSKPAPAPIKSRERIWVI